LPQLSLAARVVEVIADRGAAIAPRYGSGCLVAGRTVLTAAHVVTDRVGVRVRDPHKVVYEATLDEGFVGDAEGPRPDLALIEVRGIDPVPPIGLAAVDRDSPMGDPVEPCHAIGYPEFMEVNLRGGGVVRDTVDAVGRVPVLSRLAGGLLSMQVSSAPRELPPERVALGDSEWSGMSGAPLLGVVTEHAPREGPSAITVTPLTALEGDPAHPGWGPGVADPGAWWERLGVSGLAALRRLPARRQRPEPDYWATVREIHARTELLVGRQRELSEIASFAVGAEGYRWLVGGAWAGKTSLLAEAVTVALPSEVDVVSYFLSRREADADSAGFLAAVIPQLAYLLDQDLPSVDLHRFRALWQRAAERVSVEDRHLLLVVDGLDEDLRPPGLPSVAAILPSAVGGGAHVLVASRPHPELPSDLPGAHPLGSTPAVDVESFEGARELAALARQEIDELIVGNHAGLAVDVLGLLAAAAGPLAVEDLATMTEAGPRSAGLTRQIRRLLTVEAARSLQPVGPAGGRRYQFAHDSLLEHTQSDADLSDPEFRRRIHRWATAWCDAGWRPAVGDEVRTPRYLLDTYPSTLAREPQRLAELVSDVGWVAAAIAALGADRVLVDLRRAAAADATHPAVGAMLATVTGQAHHLRRPRPLRQPDYLLRQLWMQAAELAEDGLADSVRARLVSKPGVGLVPQWTTRRASRALSGELGRHDAPVRAVAVLPDGRVVSGGNDERVLLWDPAAPETGPADLGRHDDGVGAVAVLPDGRVVSGDVGGRVLVWDPAAPEAGPAYLGRDDDGVGAVAVLPDGRVVSGDVGGRVLVWDPAAPEAGPAATTTGWGRWRCCRTGASSAAATSAGGCWCGIRPPPRPDRPNWAATTARWRRWRCCRTGASSAAAATSGCWCGIRPPPRPNRPSWAATTARWGRWRCCRTGASSAAATTSGCGCGIRPPPRPDRPSWAATTTGWGRWRCCRTGAWSAAAATSGCCCGT
jgi:Trypsin-like peptidase domain/WD domain, G-beta repeat